MSSKTVLPQYLDEQKLPRLPIPFGTGMQTPDLAVKRTQEWLTLHGWKTDCDGAFGSATRSALVAFKKAHNLGDAPEIDLPTYCTLVAPLDRATAVPSIVDKTFGDNVCRIANAYYREHPCEAGGDNRGPWVRHFGRGRQEAWCQNFASTVWMDAARAMQLQALPFALCDDNGRMSGYVPWVANEARAAGKFMTGGSPDPIPFGSMFFLRGRDGSYIHVGIVMQDNRDGSFVTIEGNTNTDGSSNGWEVARRHRAKTSCDFGVV